MIVSRLAFRVRQSKRDGTAVVEMALILPIMLTLIFGMIDIGYVMYVNNTLTEAARAGARYAIVHGSVYGSNNSTPPQSGPTADDANVQTTVRNNAPCLSNVIVHSTWNNGTNNPGDTVTVTASCQYQTVIGSLVGFGPTLSLSGTTTMIITY